MIDFRTIEADFHAELAMLNQQNAEKILVDAASQYPISDFVQDVIVPLLVKLGNEWEQGKLALAHIYMSGKICERIIDRLLPPASPSRMKTPLIGIAVLEDYHLLGKRIVISAVRSAGFDIVDLGHGMKANQLVEKTVARNIDVLLISTLMLPSALKVKDVRTALNILKPNVKIIVGGAPFRFDDALWQEVGADAMGLNGFDAPELIARFSRGAA